MNPMRPRTHNKMDNSQLRSNLWFYFAETTEWIIGTILGSFTYHVTPCFWNFIQITVNVWTLGILIKICMLLEIVLDPLESITVIIWYTFLCKKDPTIVKHEVIPYLIFNHWFNVQFLSISLIFYSNLINLCSIYPNHHILSHRT